ncbi:MAG: VOC family protein [Steroidobacteraceae bacterium]
MKSRLVPVRRRTMLLAALACPIMAGAALAQNANFEVSLRTARVGGSDVAALSKFYESAFGLKETRRLNEDDGSIAIIMNFGITVDAAKANRGPQIAIMHRKTRIEDPVSHIVLNVSDLNAAIAAVKAAGGVILAAPLTAPSGNVITYVADPEGNQLELVQPPKPKQ